MREICTSGLTGGRVETGTGSSRGVVGPKGLRHAQDFP